MPLRDHFRLPLKKIASWEELHGGWPMVIVQQLRKHLPPGYVSAPHVHVGAQVEIDVVAYENENPTPTTSMPIGSLATQPWTPSEPSVAVETDLSDDDEYEVRIYDAERGRTLVAAIEIVSPANKDRADKRQAFVSKCAALIRRGVAVSIVDLVTTRHANLYTELLADLGHADVSLGGQPPAIYAASCRWLRLDDRPTLQTWSHALAVGQPLPTLPLWLTDVLSVPLDLETSYENACRDLSIP